MAVPAPRPVDVASEAARAAELARASKSENTRRAYGADWRRFEAWCKARDHAALPAEPAIIGMFISSMAGEGLAPSSIERMVSGIVAAHHLRGAALDRRHPAIASVLKGLKRKVRGRRKQSAAPLLPALLAKILGACGDDLRSLRDKAILLLGFSGAFRRSEIVALDVEHIKETTDGLLIDLPWSKGDQEGEGATIGIPRGRRGLCAVTAVKAWMAAADIDSGPIFRRINKWGTVELDRLSAQSVRLVVKRRAAAGDLPARELERLSGHSLRAGFITAAYARDVPEHATQKHVRHARAETTRLYNREASAFKGNPAKGLLDVDG